MGMTVDEARSDHVTGSIDLDLSAFGNLTDARTQAIGNCNIGDDR